jgi:hypothetical protein
MRQKMLTHAGQQAYHLHPLHRKVWSSVPPTPATVACSSGKTAAGTASWQAVRLSAVVGMPHLPHVALDAASASPPARGCSARAHSGGVVPACMS